MKVYTIYGPPTWRMPKTTALQLLAYIATAIGLQSLLAVAILIWRRNPPEAVRAIPVVRSRTSEAAWDGLRAFRVIEFAVGF